MNYLGILLFPIADEKVLVMVMREQLMDMGHLDLRFNFGC